ncbi:hypothetical protein MKX54_05360 [Alkalihalobacillus sp. FSL R5-0424]
MTSSTIEFYFSNGICKQSLVISHDNDAYTTFLGKLPVLFSFEGQIGVNKISYPNRDLLLLDTILEFQDHVMVSYKHLGKMIKLGTLSLNKDEMSQIKEPFQVLIDVIE